MLALEDDVLEEGAREVVLREMELRDVELGRTRAVAAGRLDVREEVEDVRELRPEDELRADGRSLACARVVTRSIDRQARNDAKPAPRKLRLVESFGLGELRRVMISSLCELMVQVAGPQCLQGADLVPFVKG